MRGAKKYPTIHIDDHFERLTVVASMGYNIYLCRCACGELTEAKGSSLHCGTKKSCGCLVRDVNATGDNSRIHGMSDSATFRIWAGMKARCSNPNVKQFRNYGGRGIRVCERWADSFENFLADMGPRPSDGHSIDRIDNNGPYSPENCRWATRTEQARNRTDNVVVSLGEQSQCIVDWERAAGLPHGTIKRRLDYGWSPSDAVSLRPGAARQASRIYIEVDGVSRTVDDWAALVGQDRGSIYRRLRRGDTGRMAVYGTSDGRARGRGGSRRAN